MSRRRPRLWPRRGAAPPEGADASAASARRRAGPPPLVLVNGRMAKRRRTGIGTYIHELRESLDARPAPDLRVEWVFGPPAFPRLGKLTSVANLMMDMLWLHVLLPFTAWRRRAAVLHAPVNWGPWFSPCPTVVTIHDLAWERVPDAFPENFRRYARLFRAAP